MIIPSRRIQDITISNIKKGEVTLMELDALYKEMGFVFIASEGKFIRIKKETKH